jgi:hypothetical protein
MAQTIDVTGLSPESVRIIESLVQTLRGAKKEAHGAESAFDLFGKADRAKTTVEILEQVRLDRKEWPEP